MTKKEFENRTGYIVPDDRFKEIETMYLEAGEDIDKDTFCKDFKKHSESVLLYRFYKQSERLKDKLDSKREEIHKLEAGLLNAARTMLAKSEQHNDNALYEAVISLIGIEKTIILKLEMNLTLQESERNKIIELMTQK